MTTTNPTIHERVTQAVARDAELQGQLAQMKEELLAAKQAEDAVRLSPAVKDVTSKANAEMAERLAKAKEIQRIADLKAQKPYDAALKVYNEALAESLGAYNKVKDEADRIWTAKVGEADRAFDMASKEAQAAVHHAKNEIASIQQTIDQHRRQVQDRLGISLSNILG